jgi:hypothetical protein
MVGAAKGAAGAGCRLLYRRAAGVCLLDCCPGLQGATGDDHDDVKLFRKLLISDDKEDDVVQAPATRTAAQGTGLASRARGPPASASAPAARTAFKVGLGRYIR